jgi:hypothetical protein
MTTVVDAIMLGLYGAAPLVLAASIRYDRSSIPGGDAQRLLREGGR